MTSGASEEVPTHVSPLLDEAEARGGVVTPYHGTRLVRHFGSPPAEYEAATERLAVFDRSHRARVRVRGRAPGQMLNGVLTGRIPGPPTSEDEGVHVGVMTYHTVLTPKGKMLTDAWAGLLGSEEEAGFLLDVPVAGRAALLEHFTKILPPRFAAVEDVSDRWGSISVVGPDAAGALARDALGLRVDTEALASAEEGRWWAAGDPTETPLVVRTKEVRPDAFTVYARHEALVSLWRRLVDGGATPAGLSVWNTLRVEAARPVFGADMDDGTIPIEAGIHERAIDGAKGCYTGQEVIVRIRDRGHVNRHLRLLRLGDVPAPAPGAELTAAGDDSGKVVGRVTSAVESPAFGEVIALAYVRREVDRVVLDGREIDVPEEEAGRR